MLSVGRRDEGGKEIGSCVVGLGAGREMEDNEVEEGEAYSGQEEEEATIDPDIALSYIDEKIQNVLGHFQKDFEGGVCAENLGAKFGGYGSFLPAHQRSPSILSQHRSPQKTLNYSTSRSPYDAQLEGVHDQKTEAAPPAPVSSKSSCLSTAISLDNSGKNDACGNGRSALESSSQQCLAVRQVNHSDQKTLKVRVKLGPDKISSSNNAAIYSGLGLDGTPSPSLGESFDDSRGSSPKSHCAFVESPMVIYEFYTCLGFAPLDSYMLSPISKSLLYMEEKDLPQLKECKTGDDILNCCNLNLSSEETPMPKKVRSLEKITKSTEKNLKPFEVNKSNVKDRRSDISTILKSEIDIETTAGREIVTSALDIPLLNVDEDEECQLPVIAAGVLQPTNNTVGKEKIISTDVMKEQDSVTSLDTHRFCNGRNEHSHVKTKLSVKPLSADKSLKDREFDILKDDTTNRSKKDGKRDVVKSRNVVEVDYNGNRTQKDQAVGPAESDKMKAPQRTVFSKEVKEKLAQGKGKSSCRRKSKGGEAKYTTGGGPMMEKDKEKNLHLKDPSDIKSKAFKSQNASDNVISSECFSNHVGLAKVEQAQADGRIESSEFLPRDKPGELNLECKKEEAFLSEKVKQKTGSIKSENSPISEPSDKVSSASLQLSNVPTSTVPLFSVPHVIEDHWVACDECEKWRLLPYEVDPNQLPKIWRCSMLYWLPGMNKCSITEEETTKALLALYHPPVAEGLDSANGHHDIMGSSAIATCSKLPQNHDFRQHTLPGAPKKKILQIDGTITNGQPSLVHFTNHSRDNQLIDAQNRSTDNLKNKPKARNKSSEIYSDGGDSFVQRSKHSKSKSGREFNQDNERDFKRLKFLESHPVDNDHNNHTSDGKTVPNSVDALTSKASRNNSRNHKKFTTPKNFKHDMKEKSLASGKNMKAPLRIIANVGAKEQHSSLHFEKSNTTKKRKIKNWQSGVHPQISEADVRKDKKMRVSKSDGQIPSASKTNTQSGKVQLPCGFQDQLPDGIGDSRGYAGKDHQPSQRNADIESSLKGDLVFSQPSTAATSSSSKVSGCRKSKANFQEVRDSPVESVSSSPLRISNSDILPTRRRLLGKDDSIHVGYSILGSPRRSSEGEADGTYNHYLAKPKGKFVSVIPNGSLKSNRASLLDPTRGACDLQAREMDASNAKNQLFTKIFGRPDDELSPSDYEEINRGDAAAVTPKLQYKHNLENQGKGHGPVQDQLDNPYHISGSNITKKSYKSSSSRSRERHKSSKIDKDKTKTSDSFNDQEGFHARKNGDHARCSTAMDSNGNYKSHEDFKDKSLGKEQKSYTVKTCGSHSSEWKTDGRSNSKHKENIEVNGSSPLVERHGNSKVTEPPAYSGKRGKPHAHENFHMALTQEDEKSSNHLFIDHMDKLDLGRGKLESASHPGEKQDSKNQTSWPAPFQGKESRSDMLGKAENGGMDNGLKHPLKIESQNWANHDSLRNVTPNRLDSISCFRKEGGSSIILKEASRLKHTANQLKNEGLYQESTGLYFQAALKFLQVALLLENSHSESMKHGDRSSIQMYSYTAKLCEFCAHEYEKHGQIAAAALAYKCMEVAYMKVVYFKHSSASKDHHELQITSQVALNGESPSSSASDVDNLNISSMIDKVVSLKERTSPQFAGSHIIAARNRPNFVRFLSYAEDVISAMEASKKSLNAFVAASASLDGSHGAEVMSSVKKVLDYNFHDVEGLLRLVRLSVELVSS